MVKKLFLFGLCFIIFPVIFHSSLGVSHNNIIGNSSISVRTVSKSTIYRIFIGETNILSDDYTVSAFLLPKNHIATKDFCTYILGITVDMFYQVVNDNFVRFRGSMPLLLQSEDAVENRVRLQFNTIGYLSENRMFFIDEHDDIILIFVE
jgi:hypothetical protein